MECSDKCKGMENMNPPKEWSFLWISYALLKEEEEDVFGADSHGWSQEVWALSPHLSCHRRHDQEHDAATTLTEIFFFWVGKWGIVILLFEFPMFIGRGWRLQRTLGEWLLPAEELHPAGESGQCLWKSRCVWQAASNRAPSPSCSWSLAWEQPSCLRAVIWWIWPPSRWQAVVSLQLCSGAGAPCSMFSSPLAEVWKQETRFLI